MTEDETLSGVAHAERGDLERQLEQLGADVLARFLVRLSVSDSAMRERIEGLALQSDPARLGKALRRRLRNLERDRSFIPYLESSAFATRLDGWLDEVEEGLLRGAPEVAAHLLEVFIRADASIFERVDDSGGSVGMVFRRACGLWTRAVAQAPRSLDRVDRVYDLHAENDYGVRDALLDEVAVLLDELELRRLARRYEDDLKAALAASHQQPRRAVGVYSAAAAMGQVACALGDAKLYERSVRILSPQPNELQREEIGRNYLRFGPVQKAIEWLEGSDRQNLDLLAQAFDRLGDRQRLRDTRKRLFEQTLTPENLASYLELLPEADRPGARQDAAKMAAASPHVGIAARLLFALDQADRAEALVLERREELGKAFYTSLQDLAKTATKAGSPLTATLCFRALTDQILGEGRSKAYHHARRYCAELEQLEGAGPDHRGVPDHRQYMAALREKHGRKRSFWSLFGEGE